MAGKIENNKPVDPNARDIQIKTKLIALIGGVIALSSFIVATLSLTKNKFRQPKFSSFIPPTVHCT